MNKIIEMVSCITILIFFQIGFALAADEVYFYYTDPSGTPLAMSDVGGNIVWKADYMPFGEELLDTATVENNKMFVGKEKDKETGFYYFGARYMDATIGRFASPDPIGPVDQSTGKIVERFLMNPQRLNRYAYAGNNPYAFVDPWGLDWYYAQNNGHLIYSNPAGKMIQYVDFGKIGVSGNRKDRNNPDSEKKPWKGPIVAGTYEIGFMQDSYTTNDGTVLNNAMELTPDAKTAKILDQLKRGGFLVHEPFGSGKNKRTAGCIGLPEEVRMIMNEIVFQNYGDSGDTTLHVTAKDTNFPQK